MCLSQQFRDPQGVHPPRRAFRNRRAYTLIEIVITLLIIGILSALVAPRVADMMVTSRVRAAAGLVVADIEYARQWAMTRGTTQAVVFSPSTASYELTGLKNRDRPDQPYVVKLTASPYEAALASAAFGSSGTGLTLTFNRFGRPDYGGSLVVTAGTKQRTILVDGVSGKATVQP